ncbi:hypothetical protein C3K47_11515 [Solitalea longa]|uniref:Phosphatidic acid phosphatase type 2/haloperoxidase domain-containing protein n=1 Tax=Solitalea longa TaxID=2079460 RepID=A0A2S5A1A1_9SPHI|nr:phosphatase PAP2 family protein [Solitalea longa]POY36368.1 hypothetical protein C3K47_11515 [Solitalea longa]
MFRYLLALFLLLSGFNSYSQNLDVETLIELQEHRNPGLENGFAFISKTAGPICIAIPVGLFIDGVITKDKSIKDASLQIGVSLVATTILTHTLKATVHRDRPFVTYSTIHPVDYPIGYSFPSGHTSKAFSTATSLSLQFKKWYVVAPAYTWATAVGVSRCYLGVHYPSDVVAGALLGSGCAYLTYRGQKWINSMHSRKHKAWVKWER